MSMEWLFIEYFPAQKSPSAYQPLVHSVTFPVPKNESSHILLAVPDVY